MLTPLGFDPDTVSVPVAGLGPKNNPPDATRNVYVPFVTVSVSVLPVPDVLHVTPVIPHAPSPAVRFTNQLSSINPVSLNVSVYVTSVNVIGTVLGLDVGHVTVSGPVPGLGDATPFHVEIVYSYVPFGNVSVSGLPSPDTPQVAIVHWIPPAGPVAFTYHVTPAGIDPDVNGTLCV